MSEAMWVFYDKATGDVIGWGSGPEEAAGAQETETMGVLLDAQYQPNTKVVNGKVVPND